MNKKSKEEKSKSEFRSKIVNYIRIHPGASFKNIILIFNIPESTLRYYLRDLEKKNQIKSDHHKGIYYPVEQKIENTLSKVQQKLMYNIKRNPNITQKELAALTKMNRTTIRNNINYLIEKEIISIIKVGKEIQHNYIYPEELEKQKMMKLITKFLMGSIDEETYWDLRRRLIEEHRDSN
jgi:predicted transcriptional regulator